MPLVWKASIAILLACLVAAMAIGIVRLIETPSEILGAGFRGLPANERAHQHESSASHR